MTAFHVGLRCLLLGATLITLGRLDEAEKVRSIIDHTVIPWHRGMLICPVFIGFVYNFKASMNVYIGFPQLIFLLTKLLVKFLST